MVDDGLKARPTRKAHVMKRKCFDWESVFAHIWNGADRDGIWNGDAESLAQEFSVTADEAHATLSKLCDRGLLEKVYEGTFAIAKWHEPDDPGAEELQWWEIHG